MMGSDDNHNGGVHFVCARHDVHDLPVRSGRKETFMNTAVRRACLPLLLATLFALPDAARAAQASAYPNKPVKFVTASVGSPQDVMGRIIGQKLSEKWGQPVVVENRPGAGSLLSISTVAKAVPDGYTVLLSSSAFALTPNVMSKPGYDAERDFIPVVIVAATPNVVIAGPAIQADTLKAVVEQARTGKLNYSSPGLGTTPQLSAEYLFKHIAQVPLTHVPFSGAPPAASAVAGGQVELGSLAMPATLQLIRAGKVRALAVTSAHRSSLLPDVPTLAEAGYPGFQDSTWVALWLPAKTPAEIVRRLAQDVSEVAQLPDVSQKMAAMGFEPWKSESVSFADFQKSELAKWARVVQQTGIKLD